MSQCWRRSVLWMIIICGPSFYSSSKKDNMENLAHFVFGVLGNAFAMFLFLSPLITFKRIIATRSTQHFSGIPYLMTLLNCLLSAWYGLPFISPDNLLVTTINGAGAAIEILYVLTFVAFAPRKEQVNILGLLVLVLTVFAAVVAISLFGLHGEHRQHFCGIAATIVSILMYGSPLTIISLVIRTKSVEYMPFFLSLFVFLCGTSWFVFGLLGNDPYIAIPNGVGCGLGAVQLILYAVYRGNKDGDDRTVEMEKGRPLQA
ncbi:bidirectional sugar transporter SWEET1-like [Andrographis paniculata]|uniref:bidirectional sugar transporter SWEET1-like n=1 Tax=Andrographis paniculata TaxID=175694 RepID=UPI0021E758B6|nr:bidirectional sugar transporter SWEET1-like [Andrographis paniculata]